MDAGEYVLGSEKDLVATARVQNAGDDAFEAKLVVQVPRGAAFTKFLLLANTAVDVTPICSSNTKGDLEEVVCDMGNPLPALTNVSLELVFQPKHDQVNDTALEFHVRATSTNPGPTSTPTTTTWPSPSGHRQDPHCNKGISWPDGPFDYNASSTGWAWWVRGSITHEKIGPRSPMCERHQQGPLRPALRPHLPPVALGLSDDPLLYLLDAPDVAQPAVCHSVPDVNYLGLG
ncbi:integrin alpha-V-like [Homarus americanus]|uniref:integrin alpha-V-like n=1 Tax=Homarus americanus TaxID=6706 RepID=UPI001C493A35|nr:integrin alpha-V-like [Homarus americanus]